MVPRPIKGQFTPDKKFFVLFIELLTHLGCFDESCFISEKLSPSLAAKIKLNIKA